MSSVRTSIRFPPTTETSASVPNLIASGHDIVLYSGSRRGVGRADGKAHDARRQSWPLHDAARDRRYRPWGHVADASTEIVAAMRSASDAPSRPLEPERLRRRAARRPPVDAEDVQRTAAEVAPQRVAQTADRRVILEHEHIVEGICASTSKPPPKRTAK